MISLQRSADRYHVRRREREVWTTFHPEVQSEFETLVALNEALLPPGASLPPLLLRDVEVLTFVFDGALVYTGAEGDAGVLYAGDFQRRHGVAGHRESNDSQSDWARVFQIALRTTAGQLKPGWETKRFSVAERRGQLCLIASHDGRAGSLLIQSGARVHSAILEAGRHLAYAFAPESRGWLHIVAGAVQLDDEVLAVGDSAGITAEHAVSLIARVDCEILLVAFGASLSKSRSNGFAP